MKNNKKIYISTPIYYPNDKLHIGHSYTTVIADVISRYKKLNNYDVYFVTGSDEHGKKIEDKAKENNIDPLKFVTKNVDKFKLLWEKLEIEYSHFIRTTDKEHKEYVKKIFTKFFEEDKIYEGEYEGLYCKPDESFFTKKQLINNKCPLCGRDVELVKEKSYFLKIENYKEWIKEILENENILIPKHRTKELINNFVDELKDLSITRTSFDWGIKPNENKKHVIYVWLDALLNYISTLTYSKYAKENNWNPELVWKKDSNVEILQIVGKEIIRFHCIYWPIILKLLKYRKPFVLAHGWIVASDGDKMSKSKGNVVDPLELIKKYSKDSIRFYLINDISLGEDGKFSEELLVKSINGILVNKFSNLVIRTDKMIDKYFNGVVPKKYNNNISKNIEEIGKTKINNYKEYMNNLNINSATKEIINYIDELNNFIDVNEPWKKEGKELENILNLLITGIWNVSIIFSPILVNSKKIIEKWLDEKIDSFDKFNINFENKKLKKIDYLFERIK